MSGTCDGRGGIEGREHGEERRRTGGSRRAVAADAGPDVEHERLDGDDVVVVGGDGGGERADVRADVEEEAAVARVQVAHDARDDVPLPASLLRHVRRHLRTRLDDARGRDGADFGTRSGMVWTAMSNAFAVHVFLTNLEATEPSSGSAHDTGWAPAARASVDAAMISTMPAFMIGARASLLGGVDGREMRPRVATLGRNDHDRSRERQSVDVRRRRRVLRPGRRRWRLSTGESPSTGDPTVSDRQMAPPTAETRMYIVRETDIHTNRWRAPERRARPRGGGHGWSRAWRATARRPRFGRARALGVLGSRLECRERSD